MTVEKFCLDFFISLSTFWISFYVNLLDELFNMCKDFERFNIIWLKSKYHTEK